MRALFTSEDTTALRRGRSIVTGMPRTLDDKMALMLSRSLNERFGEPLTGIKLQEASVRTCQACDGLLEMAGVTCTRCGAMSQTIE